MSGGQRGSTREGVEVTRGSHSSGGSRRRDGTSDFETKVFFLSIQSCLEAPSLETRVELRTPQRGHGDPMTKTTKGTFH